MPTIKITHYLNKKLKPIKTENAVSYPLYVRVLVERNVFRFKSVIFDKYQNTKYNYYLSEKDLEEPEVKGLIKIESEIIEHFLKNFNDYFDKDNSLKEVIEKYTLSVLTVLDWTIYSEFDKDIKSFENNTLSDNYRFNFIKYLSSTFPRNRDFLENSIKIDFANFDLIEDFSFIKNELVLIISKTIKAIRDFEKENYSEANPLNAYEWIIKNGYYTFLNSVDKDLKDNPIFQKIITELNMYLNVKKLAF